MTHANAPLTPEGRRRLARLVVEEGWPVRRAAERFQVSPATVSRWWAGTGPASPWRTAPAVPTTAQGGWQGALSGASSP